MSQFKTFNNQEGDAAIGIAMWDFSWLERRWPGAGYEDWGQALDELKERGYGAVRIDAYPHLVHADPGKTWELLPCWNQNTWGAQSKCWVQVMPHLIEFIQCCAEREIKVALSSWFRQDVDDTRRDIASPKAHADIWLSVLEAVKNAGLMDHIYYVDFCNEWPMKVWAPYFKNAGAAYDNEYVSKASMKWMQEAINIVRQSFPDLAYCFSSATDVNRFGEVDLSFVDLMEPHIWMTACTGFYSFIDYNFEKFDPKGYDNLVARGEKLYRSDPEHWQKPLVQCIQDTAAWSKSSGIPLVTTECWGIVDFKDWPGLNWGYILELCEIGTKAAAATGQWVGIATSNFCGPQFNGMWRELDWHQDMNQVIQNSKYRQGTV